MKITNPDLSHPAMRLLPHAEVARIACNDHPLLLAVQSVISNAIMTHPRFFGKAVCVTTPIRQRVEVWPLQVINSGEAFQRDC